MTDNEIRDVSTETLIDDKQQWIFLILDHIIVDSFHRVSSSAQSGLTIGRYCPAARLLELIS
jgi:hypothetical protein